MWQTVRDDNDVNVLKQRIVAMRTERQTNINSLTNQTGTAVRKEENVVRGAQLTMENGRGETNKDYFWIIVSKIDASLCVALSQIDRENIQAVKIAPEDSNTCNQKPEVTFYFPKYENATGTPDRSQQPARCPANFWGESCNKTCPTAGVESCDSDGLVCKAGYYRDGDTCEKCLGERRYSSSGSITCRNCPAGKKANAGHTGCEDCVQGDTCGCPTGQKADGEGGCECPNHAAETIRSGFQITGTACYCESGYKLNSAKTTCVSCASGDDCGCPNGQKWDGEKCSNSNGSCSNYPNTSTTVRSGLQITGTQCYCVSGYKLNSDATACVACVTGDNCGCPNGQKWDGEQCADGCPEHSSKTYTEGDETNVAGCYCDENYYWDPEQEKCILIECPEHASTRPMCKTYGTDGVTYTEAECAEGSPKISNRRVNDHCYCDDGFLTLTSEGRYYTYYGGAYHYYGLPDLLDSTEGSYCYPILCYPRTSILNWTRASLEQAQEKLPAGAWCEMGVNYAYDPPEAIDGYSNVSGAYLKGSERLTRDSNDRAVIARNINSYINDIGTYNGMQFYTSSDLGYASWWGSYTFCLATGGRMVKYQDLVNAGLCRNEMVLGIGTNAHNCTLPDPFSKNGLFLWLDDDCGYSFSGLSGWDLSFYGANIRDDCESNPAPNSAYSLAVAPSTGVVRGIRRDYSWADAAPNPFCVKGQASINCSSYPNSSVTAREGQQIGTTGCYCKEGYKPDNNQSSCVACAVGDDCGCSNGQKWDGTACANSCTSNAQCATNKYCYLSLTNSCSMSADSGVCRPINAYQFTISNAGRFATKNEQMFAKNIENWCAAQNMEVLTKDKFMAAMGCKTNTTNTICVHSSAMDDIFWCSTNNSCADDENGFYGSMTPQSKALGNALCGSNGNIKYYTSLTCSHDGDSSMIGACSGEGGWASYEEQGNISISRINAVGYTPLCYSSQ